MCILSEDESHYIDYYSKHGYPSSYKQKIEYFANNLDKGNEQSCNLNSRNTYVQNNHQDLKQESNHFSAEHMQKLLNLL